MPRNLVRDYDLDPLFKLKSEQFTFQVIQMFLIHVVLELTQVRVVRNQSHKFCHMFGKCQDEVMSLFIVIEIGFDEVFQMVGFG